MKRPRMMSLLLGLGLGLALAAGACTAHQGAAPAADPHKKKAPILSGLKHGLLQSPININSLATVANKHSVRLHYDTSKEHVINKGHTVQLDYDPGSGIKFDDKFFAFKQVHFHTPSEHHLDGVIFPLEAHMVHTLEGKDGVYLVIGILFKEGPKSAFISDFLADVPEHAHQRVDNPNRTFDIKKLFTGDGSFYYYKGSLTTSPYTETVSWCVARTIHTASREQILRIREIEGENARAIQSLNQRKVHK